MLAHVHAYTTTVNIQPVCVITYQLIMMLVNMHVIRVIWYYISDVMEECIRVCNQYNNYVKTTDILNTKTGYSHVIQMR